MLRDALELWDASAARYYDVQPDGRSAEVGVEARTAIPALAAEMEAELLPRALACGKSLLSAHPMLDADLAERAAACRASQITTHVLLVRTQLRTHGAVVLHWLGKERPVDWDGRSVFYGYWDNATLAIATTWERARAEDELAELRRTAFRDRLTGLPNDIALQQQLDAHTETFPFSVLMADFDGLRAANSAYGYTEGGDALIKAVAAKLAELAAPTEFLARMNTAGDEFVLLLPGQNEEDARRRRAAIESALDELAVPERFRQIYRGASVGSATREAKETAGQALGRAILGMRARKGQRQAGPRASPPA